MSCEVIELFYSDKKIRTALTERRVRAVLLSKGFHCMNKRVAASKLNVKKITIMFMVVF